ncbi:cytochrome c551/c552 [Priestia megaterium]|nr:cytochrome c551/c552 [Priestia megaterium]
MDYANKETSQSELISTIRQAIENEWKGSIQTSLTFS